MTFYLKKINLTVTTKSQVGFFPLILEVVIYCNGLPCYQPFLKGTTLPHVNKVFGSS